MVYLPPHLINYTEISDTILTDTPSEVWQSCRFVLSHRMSAFFFSTVCILLRLKSFHLVIRVGGQCDVKGRRLQFMFLSIKSEVTAGDS